MKNLLLLSVALILSVSCQKKDQVEELWIKNGERTLYGVLSRPDDGAKKQPVLIVSHGFNGTHHFGMNIHKLFLFP